MKPLVIIPTYNEKENLKLLIPKVLSLTPRCRVLVVDDGSPDGTDAFVRSLARKSKGRLDILQRGAKLGLGTAYLDGYRRAISSGKFDAVVQMDADGSSDPVEIPGMLKLLRRYDVVLASRYKDGVRVINWPRSRVVLSLVANEYAKLVARMKCSDLTNAFLAMRMSTLAKLDLSRFKARHFAFIHELKFWLEVRGARIAEVPVVFVNREKGESNVSRRVILEALLTVLRLGILRLKLLFSRAR